MLPPDFPRWAIWLLNIAVLMAIWVVGYALKLVGWEVCLGLIVGYALCYFCYGCWRVDDARENYSRFPPQERDARRQRDRAIDPRIG